jgi:hypothetical protein
MASSRYLDQLTRLTSAMSRLLQSKSIRRSLLQQQSKARLRYFNRTLAESRVRDGFIQGWVHPGMTNTSAQSLTATSPTTDQQNATANSNPIFICHPGPADSGNMEFNEDEANVLLKRFRNHMAPFLPFLVLPESLSARILNRDRPFLMNAIFAVATHLPSQRYSLGKLLVKRLSNVMAEGDRNLDMLLGVLTYTGWFVDHYILASSVPLDQNFRMTCAALGPPTLATISRNKPSCSA